VGKGCFGNETNNRLERHNAAMKQVVTHYNKVPQMLRTLLFDLDKVEHSEANYLAEVAGVKRRYCVADQSAKACSINATCSPFASKLLLQQLQLFRSGSYDILVNNGIFTVSTPDGQRHTVKDSTCSCRFN